MSSLRYDVVWLLRYFVAEVEDFELYSGFYREPVQEKYDPYTSQYSCSSALNQLESIQPESNKYMD